MTSKMESETSTFSDWRGAVEKEIRGRDLASALDTVAGTVRDRFGAHLWFVQVLGRRWSYLAGEVREQPADSRLAREELDNNLGLVIETWGEMDRQDRKSFRELVSYVITEARAA